MEKEGQDGTLGNAQPEKKREKVERYDRTSKVPTQGKGNSGKVNTGGQKKARSKKKQNFCC